MLLQRLQVSLAWRLDREMRRRLIQHETGFTCQRFLTSCFIDVDTFYLSLNWFSTRAWDDRKYVCGRRLYACINTRKFLGPRFQRNYIIARHQKNDLHGASFTSSPKINRMLITRPICLQWKFTTPDHRSFAYYDSYFFLDHSVVFTCSKVINGFKR